MPHLIPRWTRHVSTRRLAVRAAAAVVVVACAGGSASSDPGPGIGAPARQPGIGPDENIFAQMGRIPSRTADSTRSRRQSSCRAPLTGLLHTTIRNDRREWDVTWGEIRSHLETLEVEAAAGETGHILRPIEGRDTVRADIASIYGTDALTEAQALDALRCGRVIARIISRGAHDPTEIEEGTNWLVISLLQPMNAVNPQWVFVIINPEKRYRASLDAFKYTPHVVPASPTPSSLGAQIRAAVPFRPLSAAAQSCSARGWKACFIDPPPADDDHIDGHPASGPFAPRRGEGESQPWVPCPLFGCCCGGDACHTME